jgi:endonuclease/exonuclease/phosphatase family metal-dependent hydrolase
MSGRHVLFATLGALVAFASACGSSGGGENGPPDADVGDAPPDADSVPETTITSGPMGNVTPGIALAYAFTSDTGTSFECRVDIAVFSPCTSPHNITALPGAHTFEVRAVDADGDVDPTPASRSYNGVVVVTGRVRLMAGNLTSGNNQAYEAPGIHIFQGLHPDIAMIQEFNVGDNQPATIRSFVDTAFGPTFSFFREDNTKQIPNGIISRYPILASGFWEDPLSPNREFAYARIDVPGTIDLWAVSVHLLTNDASRPGEATALVDFIQAMVPAGDYLVIAGDFNSDSRTETAITTLGQVVTVTAPFPVDQGGDGDTNSTRSSPYDWVMLDGDLNARQIPVVIGANSFPGGLVFDSRLYTPLADVSPVLMTDSAALNMQHMGVVKDVMLAP